MNAPVGLLILARYNAFRLGENAIGIGSTQKNYENDIQNLIKFQL